MAARRKIMPDLFCHEAEAAFLMLFNPDDGRYRPDRDASRYEDAVAELTRNNWFSDDYPSLLPCNYRRQHVRRWP